MKVENGHAVAKLKRIIEQTREAMPNASSADMARHTMDHHAGLINSWVFGLLCARYDAMRRNRSGMIGKRPRLGHPGQFTLPLPGFEHIPPRIFVSGPTRTNKQGARVRLLSATLTDQIASLELAVNESAEELAQRRRLIALTRRYDKKQPGITVREVLKLQAARSKEASRKRAARARVKAERSRH